MESRDQILPGPSLAQLLYQKALGSRLVLDLKERISEKKCASHTNSTTHGAVVMAKCWKPKFLGSIPSCAMSTFKKERACSNDPSGPLIKGKCWTPEWSGWILGCPKNSFRLVLE